MTVTGHVRNGKIELDDASLVLEEGTPVSIGIAPPPDVSSSPTPSSEKLPMPSMDPEDQKRLAEGMMKLAGSVTGYPPDFARNHDHYIHGTPKLS